ncbi:MAG: HAMP domain-containing protein, partial [Candidatus Binatia bacterium]
MERIIISNGKRVRNYVSILQHAQDNNFRGKIAALFTRLSKAEPGDILFEGPIEHGDKTVSVLAGIAKREPEIGGFGGAVVAHVDLTDYLAHLSNFKIFGQTMAWLFDKTGKIISRPVPDEASPSPDPSAHLFGQEKISHGALIFASDEQADQRMLGLFRIALSMSPEIFSAQLRGANLITLLVLVATGFFASIIAFLVAKQFAFPIRALSQLAASVGKGDLEAQVSEEWGGELGQLAAAFNRMVQRLKKTTFSKAYVDNIIRSMNDTLVVIRQNATIEKTNDALLALLGYEEHELLGHPLTQILADSSVQRAVMEVASHDKFIAGIETTYVAKDGRKIPVSLS